MIKLIEGMNNKFIRRVVNNYYDNYLILDSNDLNKFNDKEFLNILRTYLLINKDIIIIGNLDFNKKKYLLDFNCDYINIDSNNNVEIIKEINNFMNNNCIKNFDIKLNFNVPSNYQETINLVYSELNKIDSIKLMLITGSVNRECVYDKWSDIDLILVFDQEIDDELKNKIANIVKLGKVKVGTTLYSKMEFENLMVDIKTLGAIYDLNRFKYKPTIYYNDLIVPNINLEYLVEKAIESTPSLLHNLRRMTYPNQNIDYNLLFKTLSHFMRNVCWINMIFPDSYKDVAYAFNNMFNLDYYNPNDYLKAVTLKDKDLIIIENEKLLNETKLVLNSIDKIFGDNIYGYTKVR